ncbi:MAG: type VI secretion system baseplate subunit TssF [Thermodesulfobacteriota bacterium]
MINKYFQEELANLKELGAEFAKAHPSLAPMLSGPSADPDVERLLEGVAFLIALLRQKLDDEFPELINEVMQIIWPHYLKPLPSTTLIAFTPKSILKQSLIIPQGIQIASVPIEGTSCIFQTAYEVEIHPLQILDISFVQPAGKPPAIKILLELSGLKLSAWQPQKLRFFIAGEYAAAADLYFLLRRHLQQITFRPLEKGNICQLPPTSLRPVGFSLAEGLIPYPTHAFPGYRVLQEYFICPEKFLFLDLVDWDRWQNRGEGNRFEINFEFGELPFLPARPKKDNFFLFVTPAINIFPYEADPILLDHRLTHYLIKPAGFHPEHYQVYAVEKVTGFVQGTAEERIYAPFELFNPDPQSRPAYHVSIKQSPINNGLDFYLSVAYPPGSGLPSAETLSIQLLCTNGSLPENLRVGDIVRPTNNTPEYVDFRNISPPTPSIFPPLGTNLLWRLLAHLSLNYLSLARVENLRALLELYLFPETRERAATLANKRRIAGIQSLEAVPSDRLVSGVLMRGQEIKLKMRQDHFASPGDLYLFGCILDHFLGGYASLNTYIRLSMQEILKGDLYQWPARIGDHPLI